VPDAHVLHLGDNAAFALGLLRLFDETHDTSHLLRARALAAFVIRELRDPTTGGFFESTVDPDAVGVFARRRVSFEDNGMAVRMLAKLVTLGQEPNPEELSAVMEEAVAALARPEAIQAQGRMLGAFLLAMEEAKSARTLLR
jgi:uncharacterized protein YyaL (SSP411 family)